MSNMPTTRPVRTMEMASAALSFSEHLKTFLPGLKLRVPPWLLFPATYQRKDQAKMSAQEQQRFLCALSVLIQNGTFGQLVAIHADMSHMMHGTQRFLPWHRIYLIELEKALRAVHPDVSVPYWDWTQAAEQSFPQWLQGFTPSVPTPNGTITVVRAPGSQQDLATLASNIPGILQLTDFAQFTSQLEAVHGGVHVWVGGSMSMIPTAPADPIFWMHHANIDRLWWQWQKSPQGQGKNPNLTGSAAVMDPWPYTEADTRDITSLGYSYA